MTTLDRVKFEFSKISLGDLIQLILVLSMIYAGLERFDHRISNLETIAVNSQKSNEQVTSAITKLSETLDRLQLTLETFPLHRHLDDGDILYQDGKETGRIIIH